MQQAIIDKDKNKVVCWKCGTIRNGAESDFCPVCYGDLALHREYHYERKYRERLSPEKRAEKLAYKRRWYLAHKDTPEFKAKKLEVRKRFREKFYSDPRLHALYLETQRKKRARNKERLNAQQRERRRLKKSGNKTSRRK